ncbi:MAG: hypothetical protein Q8940_22810 [Bacteroidota bacterium]|nr:hypothetical protein [Bacteroidota bacterium]
MAENNFNEFKNLDVFKTIYSDLIFDEQEKIVKVYDSESEEYDALINGAGLIDLSGCSLFELKGKDSLDYLHRITTNALKDLKQGELSSTIFTNEKGRMIDRATVVNNGDHLLVLGSAAFRPKLYSWINRYIISEDIKVTDLSFANSVFQVMGSQSRSFLSMIFGDVASKLQPGKMIKVQLEHTDYFLFLKNEFNRNCYFIICRQENSDFLLNYMFEHKSVFDFRAVGSAAYDIFRINNGIPSAPNEINDSYTPNEANLLEDVSFTKGCYIGQEVIARLDTYGKAQRKLAMVTFDTYTEDLERSVVYDNEERESGVITTASSSLNKSSAIALAYIKKDLCVEGTELIAKASNKKVFKITICSFGQRK